MVMEMENFIDYYEANFIENRPSSIKEKIPSGQVTALDALLADYKIPLEYHLYFYFRFLFIITRRRKIVSKSEKELNEFYRFCTRIVDQKLNQLTVIFKGKNSQGKYEDDNVVIKEDNPYLLTFQLLFRHFLYKKGQDLNLGELYEYKAKRGPIKRPVNSALRKSVPEINQLLSKLGLSPQLRRNEFIGRFLVTAEILKPFPPKKYKDMQDYFRSRIKVYMTSKN